MLARHGKGYRLPVRPNSPDFVAGVHCKGNFSLLRRLSGNRTQERSLYASGSGIGPDLDVELGGAFRIQGFKIIDFRAAVVQKRLREAGYRGTGQQRGRHGGTVYPAGVEGKRTPQAFAVPPNAEVG